MEHSILADKPAEVLNLIYQFALHDPEKVTLDFKSPAQPARGGQSHLVALTETCREIRENTRPMFFNVNDFVVRDGQLSWDAQLKYRSEPMRRFRQWVQEREFAQAKCIRSLEVQGLVLMHPEWTMFELEDTTIRALGPVARFFAGTGKT